MINDLQRYRYKIYLRSFVVTKLSLFGNCIMIHTLTFQRGFIFNFLGLVLHLSSKTNVFLKSLVCKRLRCHVLKFKTPSRAFQYSRTPIQEILDLRESPIKRHTFMTKIGFQAGINHDVRETSIKDTNSGWQKSFLNRGLSVFRFAKVLALFFHLF